MKKNIISISKIIILFIFIWMILSILDVGFNAVAGQVSDWNVYRIMFEITEAWRN